MTSYAFAVASLSTLLGAVVRTPAQASSIGWILGMVLAALGGCWWPSEIMPRWMWNAAHVLPTAWAMDGFHALISFGRGLDGVLLPSAVLSASACSSPSSPRASSASIRKGTVPFSRKRGLSPFCQHGHGEVLAVGHLNGVPLAQLGGELRRAGSVPQFAAGEDLPATDRFPGSRREGRGDHALNSRACGAHVGRRPGQTYAAEEAVERVGQGSAP